MNDSIDDFFEREREAVPLLAPPSGRFEQLQTVARRRRNRNTTVVSVAAAVVVAIVGTGGVLVAQGRGTSNNTALNPAASTHALNPSTAVPTTAATPTEPVPQGFQGWSVSFVHGGVDGYAVGGYPCQGGQSCFAVLETTDSMASWHTIAKPGLATEYGVNATSAIIRFSGDGADGWLVGGKGVWSTHDTGRTWHEVAALHGQHIDALEAAGVAPSSYAYAIGRDSGDLWVTGDPRHDSWAAHSSGLAPADASAVDSLQADDHMVAAIRTSGPATVVQLSRDNGVRWQPIVSPCAGHGTTAPVFALVDESITRFVCGDGSIYGYKDSNPKPVFDSRFALTSETGTPVRANSTSTNPNGTVVGYSGAGIWNYLANKTTTHSLTADVGYVGLTSNTQGIALPATAGTHYWVTGNGGISWSEKSWN